VVNIKAKGYVTYRDTSKRGNGRKNPGLLIPILGHGKTG